jgi:TnpA family transposase
MALRELLSSSQREALEAIPVDRAGLIEHYVLSDQDLSLVRRRRGAQNRLGLAVQLAFLRYPGRALLPNETPHVELLNFLARQLGISASAWESYADRDETRREHLAELQLHYGLRSFGIGQYRSPRNVADADGPANQSRCRPGPGWYRRTTAAIGRSPAIGGTGAAVC